MMDLLSRTDYRIINSEMEPDVWDDAALKRIIGASISLQAAMTPLKENVIFQWSPVADYIRFGQAAFKVLRDEYGAEWDGFMGLYQRALEFLETVDESILPRTVIHNDYNPRNVAMSNDDHVVVYDYELARIDVPQRDVIEFLSFALSSENLTMSFSEFMAFYRAELGAEDNHWDTTLKFALSKYIVTRVSLYMLGNQITRYPFLNQVLKNCVLLGQELDLS
jgi:hydroxymethylglutaryl-CoA reductase (NADPH)